MRSLNGMNFDFYICEPWIPNARTKTIQKQLEHDLLEEFAEKYGSQDGKSRYPLMNKNSGSDQGDKQPFHKWNLPLRSVKKKTNWILEPGKNSEFDGGLG